MKAETFIIFLQGYQLLIYTLWTIIGTSHTRNTLRQPHFGRKQPTTSIQCHAVVVF